MLWKAYLIDLRIMKKPKPHHLYNSLILICICLLLSSFSYYQTAADPKPSDYGRTWQNLPIIPELSDTAKHILADGLRRGNNPNAFSKVGDCDTSTDWYLSNYDLDERYYNLGEYADQFRPVIDFFRGSFGRRSLAAKPGFSAASVLSNYWTDYSICETGEVPITCEYRINNPAFVLISLGTNDGYNPPSFKDNLRAIIDLTIEQGRLPILMTKADNVEKDFSINQDIADLAAEYDIPLWNFWAAIQEIPNHGLVEDGIHLTFYKEDFSDPESFQYAWTYRNLTAMQLLDKVRKIIKDISIN